MTADTPLDPEFDTLDRELDTLFAPVRPGASMESRLVYALRNVPVRPKLNRTRKAFVWATAATVGLGTIGAGLSMVEGFEGLPMPGSTKGISALSANISSYKAAGAIKGKSPTRDGYPAPSADGTFLAQGRWFGPQIEPSVVDKRYDGEQLPTGIPPLESMKNLSDSLSRQRSAVNEFADGIHKENKTTDLYSALPGMAPAGTATPDGKGLSGQVAANGKEWFGESERFYRRAEETRQKLGKDAVTDLQGLDDKSKLALGNKPGEGRGDAKKFNENTLSYSYFSPAEGKPASAGQPAGGDGVTVLNITGISPDAAQSQLGASRGFGSNRGGFGGGGFGAPGSGFGGGGSSYNLTSPPFGTYKATAEDVAKQIKLLEDQAANGAVSNAELTQLKNFHAQLVQNPTPAPAPVTTPGTTPTPQPAGVQSAAPPVVKKLVIRSGEMEFEVESFDNATGVITGLTAPIPGGFVSTVNSEKLPNGKVRGVVVVRIPPEKLDQFVMDLRRDLTKAGELKGQKIGSQDITKQYTDLESRLRAARAMEERLLKMIKDGNGSIKELLEAEKELGVWRTKIEETEGELKYYANLAALSTLTITVFEKEIRASAGVTDSERVSTGVEVEDVEAAFRAVQTAVADAKGRVTKSELKQHAAGQFSATLHFEVAPESAGPIRDRLKQLGRVARLEIDRVQQADSGQVVAKDAKVKRGDTQFQLQLYNLANIAPRETATMTVAAANVSAAYEALRDAVARVNGRVLVANVNETDKQNVTGALQFEVKRADEGVVKTALDAAGDTVARHVTRAPEGDAVTDTKILYKLALESADRIKPRDTVTTTVAASDVAASYQSLRDAVAKVNGRVTVAQVNETDRQNVTAAFQFEVKKADEGPVRAALLAAGESIARSVIRAPENEAVTDSKVGFKVTLQSANLIRPRETVSLGLIVPEVPAAYQTLRDAVAKSGGQILNAQLNEQDKQNVTATLHFQVKRAEEPAIRAALDASGDAIGRTVVRAAEGSETTDAKVLYQVSLSAANRVRPRETATLGIEVPNVEATVTSIGSIINDAKGRPIDARTSHDADGKVQARLLYDVPLNAAPGAVDRIKGLGKVRVSLTTQDKNAPEGKFATARLDVQLANAEAIVGAEDGIWPKIKKGLSYSAGFLLTSLTWIVFGLCVVFPWALLGFGGYKLVKRVVKPGPTTAPTTPPTA